MDRWPPYGGGREGRFDCIYIYIYIYIYIHTHTHIYTSRIVHTSTMTFVTPVVEHWLERDSSMGPPLCIDPTTHRAINARSTKKLHLVYH